MYYSISIIIDHLTNISSIDNYKTCLIIAASFLTAILAFMIPLSNQAVSNISKNFTTESIQQKANMHKNVLWLSIFILIQIVLIPFLYYYIKFFSSCWAFSSIIISSLLFVITCTWIGINLFRIKSRLDYNRFVINVLKKDIKKYLYIDYPKNDKVNLNDDPKNIRINLNTLNAITEILVTSIGEKTNYKLIGDILHEVKEISTDLVNSETKFNPEQNDIFINYLSQLLCDIDIALIKAHKNHKSAIEQQITELLIDLFIYAVRRNANRGYIESILHCMSKISIQLISIGYMHSLFMYQWYTYIKPHYQSKPSNIIDQLDRFNEYLFINIKCLINNNKINEFSYMYKWLNEYLGFDAPENGVFYHDKSRKYNNLIDLQTKLKQISSIDTLNIFLESLEQSKISQTEKLINEAYIIYLFSSLQKLILKVNYYCIFKGRYKFIKQMIQRESTVIYAGKLLMPTDLSKIVKLYLLGNDRLSSIFDREFDPNYYKPYFFIYLISFLIKDKYYIDLNNINIPSYFSSEQLEHIKIELDCDLKNKINDIINVKQIKVLNKLGFNITTDSQISVLASKLDYFIKCLIDKANSMIDKHTIEQPLNEAVILKFFENTVKEIQNSSQSFNKLLDIGYGVREDITKNTKSEYPHLGLNTYLPKDIFINNGDTYAVEDATARSMVLGKWNEIINEVKKCCAEKSIEQFEEIINKTSSEGNWFIIALNSSHIISNNNYFISKFSIKDHSNSHHNDFAEMSYYEGFIDYRDIRIPVFNADSDDKTPYLLLLNKAQFIQYKQLKPYSEGTYKNSNTIDNYFMLIDEVKEDKTKVQFKIYEQYEITLDDFQGYKFLIGNNEEIKQLINTRIFRG
jgi:hypothetical protein